MQIIDHDTILVNPDVDAAIDATDVGHAWGYEDATAGRDQCGSAYFVADTLAWHAYNEGYREGCVQMAVLTGQARTFWMPPAPQMGGSGGQGGDYRCPACGQHYDPTYGHQCPGAYVL